STELCGSCHSGSRHPQDEFFFDSAHDKAGLECTSCHGQGTMLSHGSESEVTNHTWGIYEMHYPYNQTMDEEPIVCSTCHTQEWSTSQLNVIQTTISKANVNVTTIIEEVESTISLANATTGVNQTKVNQATSLIEQASDKVNLVNYDGSSGFHNPEETFAMLSDAMRLANEAGTLALEAQGEAQVANLEVRTNSVRNIAIAGIIGALILGLAIGKKW
ncbi:ammonia-forming cytochrome c nitrite reductase subunit c552, partial [Candidatus Pacearchaeota archaeon]|nr:ammonia-forming cytochrome c nitrite reductase subunit c552 [Candidatus Pacearchaeota archaeon]